MPQSPPLENTGEEKAMGASAPGQGIKGENASDASQRNAYFGGGGTTTGQTNQAGSDISRGVAAAEDSANRAAEKYKQDKEKRFE